MLFGNSGSDQAISLNYLYNFPRNRCFEALSLFLASKWLIWVASLALEVQIVPLSSLLFAPGSYPEVVFRPVDKFFMDK
ncbi:MAG: hypothetical protein BA865_12810 [Desulfobacterales bacterium S5133MH4]|nr:MAG: hypothetical protein BA865_12810 [Desulfobacterales bacterium S5133MH4]